MISMQLYEQTQARIKLASLQISSAFIKIDIAVFRIIYTEFLKYFV